MLKCLGMYEMVVVEICRIRYRSVQGCKDVFKFRELLKEGLEMCNVFAVAAEQCLQAVTVL